MIDVQYKNDLESNTKVKVFLVNYAVYKLALHIKIKWQNAPPEAFWYHNYFLLYRIDFICNDA